MFTSYALATPPKPYPALPPQPNFPQIQSNASSEWDSFLSSRISQWHSPNHSIPRRNVGGTPKNKWTPEEDIRLEHAVAGLGSDNWRAVAANLTGRNSKQCRERWMGHLDPELTRQNWTADEDLTLIRKQREVGNQWAQIKHFLPGRSILAVKNRWIWLSRREVPKHSAEFLQIVASHDGKSVPSPPDSDDDNGLFSIPALEPFDAWDETGLFGYFQ
jgi:hypothetical protein